MHDRLSSHPLLQFLQGHPGALTLVANHIMTKPRLELRDMLVFLTSRRDMKSMLFEKGEFPHQKPFFLESCKCQQREHVSAHNSNDSDSETSDSPSEYHSVTDPRQFLNTEERAAIAYPPPSPTRRIKLFMMSPQSPSRPDPKARTLAGQRVVLSVHAIIACCPIVFMVFVMCSVRVRN